MDKTVEVAVVGATSLMGEGLLAILEDRHFPLGTLHLLAAASQAGTRIEFGGRQRRVADVAAFDFGSVQLAFFAGDGTLAAGYAARAAAAGCVVIDHSPLFRRDDDIPLVVPGVNPEALAGFRARRIVATPGGLTAAMLVALKPLHDAAGIVRINAATYQSVSGVGRSGVRELAGQTADLLNARTIKPKTFAKQMAFNCLPRIGEVLADGYTEEEAKMLQETQKILGDPGIKLNVTAVRVPVFFGSALAVHLETRDKLTAAQARDLFERAPGIEVVDERDPVGFPTAVTEAANEDSVFVGRIREDLSHPRGLDLWVVADEVRQGAALTGVQIGEILVKDYL